MFGKQMSLILQVQQRPIVVIATQDNASAITTIAAIRSTIIIIFHMLQVHAASPTLTRAAQDLHVIYEIAFCHVL
jgi:hypothetical protein